MKRWSPIIAAILLLLFYLPTNKLPVVGTSLEAIPRLSDFFLFPKSLHHNSTQFDLPLELPLGEWGPVDIGYDSFGVPHIFSENENGAAYGIGFCHARDRLFQLEMMRRTVLGRLSEVVGERALGRDKFWAKFNFAKEAEIWESELRESDPLIHETLKAYSQGVNDYLNFLNHKILPLEFKLLGFKPMPMEVSHLYLLIKYMSFDLSYTEEDLRLEAAYQKLGPELYDFYYPLTDPYRNPVHKRTKSFQRAYKLIEKPHSSLKLANLDNSLDGPAELGKGSNNWAVSTRGDADAFSILCNDMHLALNLPGIWYEVHLSVNGRISHGLSLAGAPSVVSGFNESLAWGMTNATWNLCDFFELEWDEKGRYIYEGEWIEPEQDTLSIPIRGKEASRYIRTETKFGLIDTIDGNVLAVDWIGTRRGKEAKAFISLMKAMNLQEGLQALKSFGQPPQNFVLADKTGSIAICTAGEFAFHEEVYPGVRQGRKESDKASYLPSNDYLLSIDPSEGFLYSANQASCSDTSLLAQLGSRFASNARSKRIDSLLSRADSFSVEEMKQVQNDVIDGDWEILRKRLIEYAPKDIVALIKDWQGRCDTSSYAATFFVEFKKNLHRLVVRDLKLDGQIPPQSDHIFSLISRRDSLPGPDAGLHVKALIEESIELSRTKLNEEFETDSVEYGSYHGISFEHITGIEALSSPQFVLAGSNRSVRVAPGRSVRHGASQRSVVALHPEGPEAHYVIAGGQSGRFNSDHSQDQIPLWLAGKYRKIELPDTFDQSAYVTFIRLKGKASQ